MDEHRAKRLKPDDRSAPTAEESNDEDTDFSLAILQSLFPDKKAEVLLDYLLAYGGSYEKASDALSGEIDEPKRKQATIGYQSSLNFFTKHERTSVPAKAQPKQQTKKGQTLHLYSPIDIETNTPCSIVHNFLPPAQAHALLQELLDEAPTFKRGSFQLFGRTVQNHSTFKFYLDTAEAVKDQETNFCYDGSVYESGALKQTTPELLRVSQIVKETVNEEVRRRMRDYQPDGKKLKFQSPEDWEPNASFVNCYDGPKENVGYHSDQLTYLGPRAVIGSLSLGVAREFRVRRIVPPSEDGSTSQADEQGQIAIHLPHNSLLVMHAEMQEEWKHSIALAKSIDPHPLAANRRLNVTYRCYKDYLHPRHTPKCKCDVPMVLRCVQKRAASRGRYMWQCFANYQANSKKDCGMFVWAELDEDGKPPWYDGYKGNANLPVFSE
ncbi:putative alkylated DNA repair protein alkB 3 [Septoria linicola]|nr:putative alkylated DNA repair protein alkB 3 [Septoria linicola]